MTARAVVGCAIFATGAALLAINLIEWWAIPLLTAMGAVFLWADHVTARREARRHADRAQVARMAARAHPTWYREDEGVRW